MEAYDPNRITYIGQTDTRNRRVQFGIKAEDRTKHMYVIGKTGMGKSTLLDNMAIQDIQNGEGLAFIDPHGASAEKLLDFIPEHRIKDVLYFAPFDLENPVSFNIMEDIGPDKRHLVVSGLMSTFKKIWVDAWSARMEYILQNTLLALLEYPGATLLGVNKMLSDKDFRKKVVDNIQDPATKSFWVDEFAKYTERFAAEAVPAIQNKVGQFSSNPLIRNIIGQPKSTFDLREIMDQKKILIVNLSKGLVGEGNAALLGGMLITKIYLAALSRADAPEATMKKLPNFYLYVDEFQSFANEAFAGILSEARKYKLNLTMAHQYVEQMEEEVRDAVFGNVGTMIVFRVGPFDAEVFEKEFLPTFLAEDFVNLGRFQMYMKLMIDGVGSQPFSAMALPPAPKPAISFKDSVIANSREMFSRLRGDAEDNIRGQLLSGGGSVETPKESAARIDTTAARRPALSNTQAEGLRSALKLPTFEKPATGASNKKAEPLNGEGLRAALASVLTNEELPPLREKQTVAQPLVQKPSPVMKPTPSVQRPPVLEKDMRSEASRAEPRQIAFDRKNEAVRSRPPQPQNNQNRPRDDRRGDVRNTPPYKQQSAPPKEPDGKSLKDALAELIKKESPKVEETKQHAPVKQASTTTHNHSSNESPRSVESDREKQNEIPEDKLRKMLEVDS